MSRPVVPEYGPATYGERDALPIEGFQRQLDAMLAGMPAFGPSKLDALAAPTADQEQAAAIAAAFFMSGKGRKLLDFLADSTVRRPMALPPLGTPAGEAYLHVQRRAGQDDIFFFLLRLIALGRQENPPTREGAQI